MLTSCLRWMAVIEDVYKGFAEVHADALQSMQLE